MSKATRGASPKSEENTSQGKPDVTDQPIGASITADAGEEISNLGGPAGEMLESGPEKGSELMGGADNEGVQSEGPAEEPTLPEEGTNRGREGAPEEEPKMDVPNIRKPFEKIVPVWNGTPTTGMAAFQANFNPNGDTERDVKNQHFAAIMDYVVNRSTADGQLKNAIEIAKARTEELYMLVAQLDSYFTLE
jgi:hypothetical protein